MLWGKGWRSAARIISFADAGRRLPQIALLAALMALAPQFTDPSAAKTPGARYCFSGWCHRVGTLQQTESLVGWRGYVLASYYDDCRRDRLNPCGLTSSGAVFRADLPDNAASPLFPDGTVILAYNPKSGGASVLRITNAGPYSGQRKLDVSRAAAESLGFRSEGVAHLVVSVLQAPTVKEAAYVRRRVYAQVPGYLGRFDTFDLAYAAGLQKLDLDDAAGEPGDFSGSENVADSLQHSDDLVLKPRPAVSPYFARELVMLKMLPRPVRRAQSAASEVEAETSRTEARASGAEVVDFGSGLRKYIAPSQIADTGARAGLNP